MPDVADTAVANEVARGVVESDACCHPVKSVRLRDSPSKDGHADESAADGAEDGDFRAGLRDTECELDAVEVLHERGNHKEYDNRPCGFQQHRPVNQ